MKKKRKKTASQQALAALGSAGGSATFKKHGKAHMSMIAKKRWLAVNRKKKVSV